MPEPVHEDYLKTLKCDCCGKEIISSRFPVCVINPYEVLCMECFRAETNRRNARVIKENANIYRLRQDLENAQKSAYNNELRVSQYIEEKNQLKKRCSEYKERNKELIDIAYNQAIATDSASAIEILRNLKEEFKKDDNND